MRQSATASPNHKLKPSSNLKMIGSVRARVIRCLLAIQHGQSLSSVLDPLLNSLHDGDKGFAHALLLTTLRQWHALARLLDSLADNPIDEIEVRTTIQLGLTQLLYLDVAEHAAIHETVEAVKEIEFAHASGLVNAILRKVNKNPAKFRKKCNKKHSLPNWLAYQLKQDWSEYYDDLMQGLRQPAPMFLRVNTLADSVNNYQQTLAQADISAELVELNSRLLLYNTHQSDAIKVTSVTHQALRLEQSMAVSGLPNFAEGDVSIQDLYAQLAAPLLYQALKQKTAVEAQKGDEPLELTVLDACAAPGGKLAHLLELLNTKNSAGMFHVKQSDASHTHNVAASLQVTAIDNEAPRIERIYDNLQRLNLKPTDDSMTLAIVCADATRWQLAEKNSNELAVFDAILLDAPCTATGVIRRHPDISILRSEEDIEQTAQLQADILHNLWPQLKVGGYFLYVTCSILKQENVEQMQDFLAKNKDATAIEITNDSNWGLSQEVGRQCLPIDSELGDGFYYALLQKTTG